MADYGLGIGIDSEITKTRESRSEKREAKRTIFLPLSAYVDVKNFFLKKIDSYFFTDSNVVLQILTIFLQTLVTLYKF